MVDSLTYSKIFTSLVALIEGKKTHKWKMVRVVGIEMS